MDVGQSYFCLKDTVHILSATLGEKRLEDEADNGSAERGLILTFDHWDLLQLPPRWRVSERGVCNREDQRKVQRLPDY